MQDSVFNKFSRFEGHVPIGYEVDFLGVIANFSYFIKASPLKTASRPAATIYQKTEYPAVNYDLFEWIDVLETVVEAQDSYTFVELGAGYGRWLARAAAAVRNLQVQMPLRLIGVEAEPTHFEWLLQHLIDNGINPKDHLLHCAAVSDREEEVLFAVGDPNLWYGQAVVESAKDCPGRAMARIQAVTLTKLLESVQTVDLVHMDIQGLEQRVVHSTLDILNAKVKRLHIGTHTKENEILLREALFEQGWVLFHDFPMQSTSPTEWGPMFFEDGVQSWINPRLVPSAFSKIDLEKRYALSVTLQNRITQQEIQLQKLHDLESEVANWRRTRDYIRQLERFLNPRGRRAQTISQKVRPEEEVMKQMLDRTSRSKLVRLHRFLEKIRNKLERQRSNHE